MSLRPSWGQGQRGTAQKAGKAVFLLSNSAKNFRCGYTILEFFKRWSFPSPALPSVSVLHFREVEADTLSRSAVSVKVLTFYSMFMVQVNRDLHGGTKANRKLVFYAVYGTKRSVNVLTGRASAISPPFWGVT